MGQGVQENPPKKPKEPAAIIVVQCPVCDISMTRNLKEREIKMHGSTATTNGVITICTATVKCGNCGEKFDTTFERFTKPLPKAQVVTPPQ